MGTLLIITVVLLGMGLAARLMRRTERRTRTFADDRAVRHAEVTLRSGEVSVAATAAGEPVRVHRTVRWALTRPATSERVEDGVLLIEAHAQRLALLGSDVTYRVEIPAGADVLVSTGAGAIEVDGIAADVHLTTRAGKIVLSRVGGRIRATTQAGSIEGAGLTATDVEATSSAGGVVLAFDAPPARVRVQANAGGIELLVPDERYAVSAIAEAGPVDVDVAEDPGSPYRLSVHANAGAVRVRRDRRRAP